MRTGYIYGLICPQSKEIFYIGHSTIKLSDRLNCHKYVATKNKCYPLAKRLVELKTVGLLDELQIVIIRDNVRTGYPYINMAEQEVISEYTKKGVVLLNARNAYKHHKFYDEQLKAA